MRRKEDIMQLVRSLVSNADAKCDQRGATKSDVMIYL